MKKTQIVTNKDDTGKEEWWCNWFTCRNCNVSYLYISFKYCPNCGIKLIWKL